MANGVPIEAVAPGGSDTERERLRDYGLRLVSGADGVHHFPIRHHSPACALHLKRALAELRPDVIVLEMPADFGELVPLLLKAETVPPVAIVAVSERSDKSREAALTPSVLGYWPISASSPEWVAMKAAKASGARLVLADLASGWRLADEALSPSAEEPTQGDDEAGDDETGAPGSESKTRLAGAADPGAPTVLTGDGLLSYSAYAESLVRRTGSRDFNEVWDRLFESRAGEDDWRGFFSDVGAHCLLCRETTSRADMAEDGTLSREIAMRAAIAAAKAEAGGGTIAVILGGFHTPAMLDPPIEPEPAGDGRPTMPAHGSPSRSYLIRYSEDMLDRLNGYASGMPSPGYYARLMAASDTSASEAGDPAGQPADDGTPARNLAAETLLELRRSIREARQGQVPALPSVIEAVRHAGDLATLRGLPGPGRMEIFDAARSCLVKDELHLFASPVLARLRQIMAGDSVGTVPRDSGAPPLVADFRRRAAALRFSLESIGERSRELDIHRKPQHRAASRFLHAAKLLDTGFARIDRSASLRSGPGRRPVLTEVWTYAFKPSVEARLTALAGIGDSLETACLTVLARRIAALRDAGRGDDCEAAAAVLVDAAKAGLMGKSAALVPHIGEAIASDADFCRVVGALQRLEALWRGRRVLGLEREGALFPLVASAYRRAVDLMAGLTETSPERAGEIGRALAGLYHLVDRVASGGEGAGDPGDTRPTLIDPSLFDERIRTLHGADTSPYLAGVISAIAHLAGWAEPEALAETIRAGLAADTFDGATRCAPLAGAIAVLPALLRRAGGVIDVVDQHFESIDEDQFVALLPALRRTFSALDPDEVDALAGRVAEMKALGEPLDLAPSEIGEAEMLANTRRAAALATIVERRGLGAWLDGVIRAGEER
ncbi:hypothetical protein DYI37_00515 [Fulvimarina endophytica]|uniref:Uncharacterized protein n=1 Tax=Fulvimarina endophytica TaxID=2293836 RepID=A0A371X9Y1_9HYPH|nr:DUF5682 family protein [Fulvimarina endophytica]RFC66002.1 hypothetical protein DYI37_00515 [Fulvimarina endophytica]